MIAVTGATGQLGRLVINALLKTTGAEEIVAVVRSPEKASDLGVIVRQAEYGDRAALVRAFDGVEKLLLISSSEVGQRTVQHQTVIDAAKEAGVKFIAYTSLLNADRSPLGLATEHLATEAAIAKSGLDSAILRNGWYTENYVASVQPALQHHLFPGCAGEGKIASATRADYAEAAAAVLTQPGQGNRVYELAGDSAYTLGEFAAEITRLSGEKVEYLNLPQAEFAKVLTDAGLPAGLAEMLADCDAGAAQGALYHEGDELSTLIGRPTTHWRETLAQAIHR